MKQTNLTYAILREDGSIEGDFDNLVPWWSITKTVLASAVLKLVEDGILALEATYKDHPFTIKQLLQHTAGLNSYGGKIYCAAVEDGDAVWSVEELLTRAKADKLIFQPGKGWAYSNIGYLFVRLLIEETMGMDINEALRRIVFEPMGISQTKIAKTPADYRQTLWGQNSNYDPLWVYHRLLVGPPSDAVMFLDNLLNKEFLAPKSLHSMKEEYALGREIEGRPWTKIGYGLGFMMGEMGSAGNALGHSGVGHDTVSALYCFRDLRPSAIVAVFAQGTNEGVAEHGAVRLALGHKSVSR